MRLARKLFLLAIVAVAAMAFAAPASASSGVEIVNEDSELHCPQVFLSGDHDVTGGCPVHADTTSPASLFQHTAVPSEVLFSACDNEFSARINESGSGWIFNQVLTDATPNSCGITACDEAPPEHDQIPWPVQLTEPAPDTTTLRTTFCVRGVTASEGTAGTSCTVDVNVLEEANHSLAFVANQAPCINLGGVIELSGTWASEGGVEAEITHP